MNCSPEDNLVVGIVEIGQSPRPDVLSDVKTILGSSVEIIECGALDGLSREKIREFEPSPGGNVLVTRLRDGTEVKLNKNKIIDRMQQCIERIEDRCRVIIIYCTGNFPELHSKRLLIKPSHITASIVQNLLLEGRLGLLIPTPEQEPQIIPKWKRANITLHFESISAYEEQNLEKVKEVAMKFQKAAVDMIVLDCMGYNMQLNSHLKQLTGVPVIQSNTLVARIVREIL
jgi:protein AroM